MLEALAPADPALVIGHSYGAVLALRYALECPERVDALVLYEPVFFAAARGLPSHSAYFTSFAPFEAAMIAGEREAATRLFHGLMGEGDFDALPPATRRYMVERIHLIPAGAPLIIEDRCNLLAPGRLEGLGCPVLLMEGAEALPVIRDITARLAERLSDARRVTIPGAGHMGPLTHAAQVAAEIEGFRPGRGRP